MGYDEPSSKRQGSAYGQPVKRANPWIRRGLLAAIAVGVGAYFAADPQRAQDLIQKFTSDSGPQQAAGRAGRGAGGAPAPVRVATAEIRDVPVTIRTIGTVLANSVVTIKSQVDGPLLSAGFREGQMVKKGDLLFRIDPAPFEAALRQSEAQVERDRAQLSSAQADADRAIMLAQRGIVSEQQRDQLVSNAKALQASIAADTAAVERAQLNLSYTTIRSPVNGKTGSLIVFPGNQVHASDANGLITITEIQPVKIAFNLPQGDLPQLQDRLKENALVAGVMVRSDVAAAVNGDYAGIAEIPIKVDFVGNAVDDKTGTIELRATFDNPDLRLVPGELVDVSVRLATLKQAISVPREAVNVGQNGSYVFAVDDTNKAQMRPVTVLYQDQSMAALGAGINAGDRVVTDGQLRLTPGATVLITQPEGAASAARKDDGPAGVTGASHEIPAAEAVKVSNPQAAKSSRTAAAPGG